MIFPFSMKAASSNNNQVAVNVREAFNPEEIALTDDLLCDKTNSILESTEKTFLGFLGFITGLSASI